MATVADSDPILDRALELAEMNEVPGQADRLQAVLDQMPSPHEPEIREMPPVPDLSKPLAQDVKTAKQAEQQEDQQEQEGEEKDQEGVWLSQDQYEQFLDNLNTATANALGLGGTTQQPEPVAQQQTAPPHIPEPQVQPLSESDLEEIFRDPRRYVEYHTKREQAVAAAVMQELYRVMPFMVAQHAGPIMGNLIEAQNFFSQHREYERAPALVMGAIQAVKAKEPALNGRALYDKVAETLSFAKVKAARIKKSADLSKTRGQFAPKGTSPRRPQAPHPQKTPVDPTVQALHDIYGKRTTSGKSLLEQVGEEPH